MDNLTQLNYGSVTVVHCHYQVMSILELADMRNWLVIYVTAMLLYHCCASSVAGVVWVPQLLLVEIIPRTGSQIVKQIAITRI